MISTITNTVILIVCAVAGGAIVAAHTLMYIGLMLAAAKERALTRSGATPDLSVAVVVPARNESSLLQRLLDSLSCQTTADFHIILVNDRSTDGTYAIMKRFADENAARTTIVDVTQDLIPENGKLNALVHGTHAAESDLILFTDADCVVPPGWVERTRARYADKRLGLLMAPIETVRNGTIRSVFHSFDHVFKYSYNAGCSGVGMPTGGFGNNLSVRRAALLEIGGLEAVEVTVTEDAALIASIRENTDWRIRASFAREITVVTETQPSWRRLTEQEVRWHTGGIFSPDATSRLSYRFVMFYLLASVVAGPAVPFVPVLGLLPVVSFVTMFLIAVIGGLLTRQPLRTYWLPLVILVLFAMVYNSLLTVMALCRRELTWKGRPLKPRP